MIDAVGVVIPARDEQNRIGRCLDSVRQALSRVPDGVEPRLCVVMDSCTDPDSLGGRGGVARLAARAGGVRAPPPGRSWGGVGP